MFAKTIRRASLAASLAALTLALAAGCGGGEMKPEAFPGGPAPGQNPSVGGSGAIPGEGAPASPANAPNH